MKRLLLVSISILGGCAAGPYLARPAPDAPAIVFQGVRIFDGVSDQALGPFDVLVQDGRIAAIEAPGTLTIEGAETIEGAGRMLLPGLWDAHVHLGGGSGDAPWHARLPDARAQLAALSWAGVTGAFVTARDIDNARLARELEGGRIAGPRLVLASRLITAPGGHPAPLYRALVPWPLSALALSAGVRTAGDGAEARRIVRRERAEHDPDFVKVVFDSMPPGAPRLSEAVLQAALDEARRWERPAAVHAGTAEEAVMASEAGAAVLVHVPWRTPLDEAQAARIAATGIPVITTVNTWAALDAAMRDALEPSAMARAVLGEEAAGAMTRRPEGFSLELPEAFLNAFGTYAQNARENLLRLRAAGVPLLAGTDSGLPTLPHGAALHDELALLVALGLPPAEVLRMATSEPARRLMPGRALGVVRVGGEADLLLIDGDALADPGALRRIVGVWKGGRRILRPQGR